MKTKKILIATLLFMLAIHSLFLLSLILLIINTMTIYSCYLPTNYYFDRMHKVINRGDMEWNYGIESIFQHLRECNKNKRQLAERFLSDKDGSLVSLGMDLVILESLPDGDKILEKYENDKRWNFNMKSNSTYSKFLLVVWKMKNNIPLNKEDDKIVNDWPKQYFIRFGVN